MLGGSRTRQAGSWRAPAVVWRGSSHHPSSERDKDEVVDPAASNSPSDFGRVVVAFHSSLNSLDSRLDTNSGCGRK